MLLYIMHFIWVVLLFFDILFLTCNEFIKGYESNLDKILGINKYKNYSSKFANNNSSNPLPNTTINYNIKSKPTVINPTTQT